MRILMIGGTGPSGIPIVERLVEHGHDVTILHRGEHERSETPPDLVHIHADPYDEVSFRDSLAETDVGRRRRDVRTAPNGRGGDGGSM